MSGITPSPLAAVGVSTMNRYGLLFLLIIGIFGNALNVYIFSRVHLRQNTCVLCLLLSSCLNLVTLLCGVFTRCLTGYNIDLTYNSPVFCKLRLYLIYVPQSASLWLIVFACIDRYLSSSLNIVHRRWINRKKIHRIIACILSFTLLSYIEVFYCFEASFSTNGLCGTRNQLCSFADTANFLVFNSFLPPCMMLGFGIAMLMNIKNSRQRVGQIPSNSTPVNKINRRDKQLMSMLLLQVALIVLCMFPVAVMKFYLSITSVISKSKEQVDTESFAYQVSITFSYINSSGMFFIYTLRGKLFRDELIRLFDRCYSYRNILCLRIDQILENDLIERF